MNNRYREKERKTAVCFCLDAMVGTTCPQADSAADSRIRQQNVPVFEAVCDWVTERIEQAYREKDSPYGSAREVARAVIRSADMLTGYYQVEAGDADGWLADFGYAKEG